MPPFNVHYDNPAVQQTASAGKATTQPSTKCHSLELVNKFQREGKELRLAVVGNAGSGMHAYEVREWCRTNVALKAKACLLVLC